MRRSRRFGAGVLAVAMTFGVAACGDDSDSDEASTEEESDDSTTTTAAADGETVTVTGIDYAFEGLPAEIEAGTKLAFVNGSAAEAHELVAILIPEAEERSVSELIQLPEEELFGVFGGEPEPATVLLAPPSSTEQIEAVGDGTISEPGRYAVLCFLPVGGDPAVVLDPNAEGPPESDAPPHASRGMFAELVVT